MISLIAFIKTTPTEVVPSPPIAPLNETLEILTKVNEFYDSAWSKLIFLLAGGFAILGIIMPFVIQHFQNKALKASEKELETKYNSKLSELRQVLENDLNKKLEEQIEIFKDQIEKKMEKNYESANASTLHMQANVNRDKKFYQSAIRDYLHSSTSYAIAEEFINLKATLTGVTYCLDFLKKSEIDYLEEVENIKLLETLDIIENKTISGSFTREIRGIKGKLHTIKNKPEEEKEVQEEPKKP
ncbi:hypothetical protein B0A81_09645 [Flavobacterium plurextorum]|uniref:Uncharacterized protein n=1 Tax=Flavobacterium plurextorum TaxID=1114867 RepID=A0ABX4CWI6_9FLAO|nr:hypothetical protein [Flavobacterium plurextorum]OXB08563.1 hypothetical protein B0A81_09645 [Flavobacterium plurextorum]